MSSGSRPQAADGSRRAAKPVTLRTLAGMKARGERIVMITAYDHPSAVLAEEAGVDVILVGDSAANCVLGYSSTVSIGLDEMIMLGAAVRRGATTPLLVVDMPFGSYEASDEIAVTNAQRLIRGTGADAVKLEGAGTSSSRARAIVDAGIAVMGHIGLTPQSASALGGMSAQARTADAGARLLHDAAELERAGCFSIVLEAVPEPVARAAAAASGVPLIGIGAGAGTDGQVLVWHDLLGVTDARVAKFVKRFADVHAETLGGLDAYSREVRAGTFPGPEHCYAMRDGELAAFEAARRPAWIVFDFGNVLSRTDAGPAALAERLGIDVGRVAAAYWHGRAGYDLNDAGYWPGVLAELGADAPIPELVRADNDAWLDVQPESAELLGDLARSDVPLALLSNAPSSFGADLRQSPTGRLFSELIVSGDIGAAKPDAAAFAVLLERLGNPDPARVVFFDDKRENVDAALAAGIDALLWSSADEARSALRRRGIDPEERAG